MMPYRGSESAYLRVDDAPPASKSNGQLRHRRPLLYLSGLAGGLLPQRAASQPGCAALERRTLD